MERTTKIFLLNDTSKALKNQDFSKNWFRSGHSFSSQGRYNHFDTAAYLFQTLPVTSCAPDPHDFKSAECGLCDRIE